ncbi:MAG TPA: hypothetical protein V6D29_13390 [Leptolyngbyaceae cyanobacterium]
MGFEIVETSVLQVRKQPIGVLAGLADHYFLSETSSLHNSLGWGPEGVELRGTVRITSQQLERVNQFISADRYSIALNNCEHFANYVLHSINLSSQQHIWWKALGAEVITVLQPTQSKRENYSRFICQQLADNLNKNLRQIKIESANRERIEFWRARGIEVQ